jgi:hypothetical protein
VQPIIIQADGLGIISTTGHPASALLLTEFILTDGRQIFAKNGRLVATTKRLHRPTSGIRRGRRSPSTASSSSRNSFGTAFVSGVIVMFLAAIASWIIIRTGWGEGTVTGTERMR